MNKYKGKVKVTVWVYLLRARHSLGSHDRVPNCLLYYI